MSRYLVANTERFGLRSKSGNTSGDINFTCCLRTTGETTWNVSQPRVQYQAQVFTYVLNLFGITQFRHNLEYILWCESCQTYYAKCCALSMHAGTSWDGPTALIQSCCKRYFLIKISVQQLCIPTVIAVAERFASNPYISSPQLTQQERRKEIPRYPIRTESSTRRRSREKDPPVLVSTRRMTETATGVMQV